MAMFGYITELEYVEMKETFDIEAEGSDMESLLFHFLDEFLFNFCAEPNFIPRVTFFISYFLLLYMLLQYQFLNFKEGREEEYLSYLIYI